LVGQASYPITRSIVTMVIRLNQFATARLSKPVIAACRLIAFERGEIGPDLFRKVYEFGLKGIVSKHRDSPCRAGRCEHWIKNKNGSSSPMRRIIRR
jgi:ATP-dependent DNA ligase